MVRHQNITFTNLIRLGLGEMREHIAPSEEFDVIVLWVCIVPYCFLQQEE